MVKEAVACYFEDEVEQSNLTQSTDRKEVLPRSFP
jgi:hypothetical protein